MKTFILILFLLVIPFTSKAQPNPIQETNLTNFETHNIEFVKVVIENFQYKIYYFDLTENNFKFYVMDFVAGRNYSNTTFKNWTFSVMTIPFKVRPKIQDLSLFAKADIKNIGIYTGVFNWTTKRFLKDGTTTETKLSLGGIISPAVEEFNSGNTNGQITTATNQMIISTGVLASITYRNVTFAIIPAGIDFGLTSQSKKWVYREKYWFGFGIGLDSKLLGF